MPENTEYKFNLVVSRESLGRVVYLLLSKAVDCWICPKATQERVMRSFFPGPRQVEFFPQLHPLERYQKCIVVGVASSATVTGGI